MTANETYHLTLYPAAKSENVLGDALEALVAGVCEARGGRVERVEPDDRVSPLGRPALEIGIPGGGRATYLALPEGPEQGPFEELLDGAIGGGGALDGDAARRLSSLADSADILVFIAAECPHCPGAVRAALTLALASPAVAVSVVDAQRFPELAARYRASSVPLTVLDDGFTWTGVVPAAELAAQVLARGSAGQSKAELGSLIEAGRLDEAARRIAAGRGGDFVALWKESATASRIALMMLAEELLEEAPAALDGQVSDFVGLLAVEDAALRGDTADLLGQIGRTEALDPLRSLAGDPNPDVAEIAAEAVEAIEERRGGDGE